VGRLPARTTDADVLSLDGIEDLRLQGAEGLVVDSGTWFVDLGVGDAEHLSSAADLVLRFVADLQTD
ncbi:MAG TPA: hypothetical protein VIK38_00615, partial [Coriobacteriia bacterium]